MIEHRAFVKDFGKWTPLGPWRETQADAQADIDALANGRETVIDTRIPDSET